MSAEAIIRAWKGEKVEGNIPMSPVEDADFDGSRSVALFDTNTARHLAFFDSSTPISCSTINELCKGYTKNC